MQVKSCLKQTKICFSHVRKGLWSQLCVCYKHPSTCSKPSGTGPCGTHHFHSRDPYLRFGILLNCPGSSQCCLWTVMAVLAPVQISVRGSSPGGLCSVWLIGVVHAIFKDCNCCFVWLLPSEFFCSRRFISCDKSQMATLAWGPKIDTNFILCGESCMIHGFK